MNAMAIVFRGGQQYETLAQLGLFNMFSRMLLEGAGSLNREEIARRLEDRGGLVNSFSGSNSFGFTFSYFPEYEEKILSTTLEFLQNPTFPEHALKILKDKMTEGLELLDESVVDVSQKILRKNLYGEHPYAYLLRGEASTIANLSREDLINTQKKFILASNMVAAVSGTISPRIENFLNQIRGDVWEQQPNPFSRLPLPKDPILMEIDKDQKIYHLAFYSPELGHEDIPALELLTSYFNGLGGPLFGLRENSGYAYQVSFSHQPRQDVGTLVFTITLGNHVHGKDQWVRSGFDRVIRHVAKGKITHEEVLRAFYSLRGMKGLMMQNRLDETFQIALYERFGLGFEKYFEESKLELTDASVLKESMVRVASRYLFDQPSVFIKVGSAS
jgi:zinc protease